MDQALIISILPHHRDRFKIITAERLYVRDYKHYDLTIAAEDNRGVVIESNPDPEWDSVTLFNQKPGELFVVFDSFPENALPEDEVGKYASQCECVLFPADGNENDWLLFIETKYTQSEETAHSPAVNYPGKMFSQIRSTVDYFRRKGILPLEQKVYAIMSFPKLLEPFDSWAFPVAVEDQENGQVDYLTIIDILTKYRIHIRSTNQAHIISPKRIKLGTIG